MPTVASNLKLPSSSAKPSAKLLFIAKYRPFFLLIFLLSTSLLNSYQGSSLFAQSTRPTVSKELLDEWYRNVSLAVYNKNYNEAIANGLKLIENGVNDDQVYVKIVQAAKASGQLENAKTFFTSMTLPPLSNPKGYFGLGLASFELKEFDMAIIYLKKCLSELPEFAPPLLSLIDVFRANGNFDGAKTILDTMVNTNSNDPVVHFGLSYYYFKAELIDKAVNEIDIALSLSPKNPDFCYQKVYVLFQAQRRNKALEAANRCFSSTKEQMTDEQKKAFLHTLASLHIEMLDYSVAADLFKQVLQLSQKLGDKRYEEASIGYLAIAEEMSGQYSQALLTWNRAYAIARDIKSANLCRYPWRIGNVYFLLGDLPEALQQFQKGLDLSLATQDKDMQAIYLSRIGDVFAAQNQPARAIEYYKKLEQIEGIARTPALRLFLLDLTYPFYLKTGQYPKAQEAIEQALSLADQLSDAERKLRALNSAGELYLRLNTPTEAASQYQKALQFSKDRNSPLHSWMASAGLAAAYRQMNQSVQARDSYLEAIRIMEDVRSRLTAQEEKVGFFQDKVKTYKDLIAALIELHGKEAEKAYDAEAFDYAERARGRGFLDLLAESKVNLDQSLDPTLLEKRQIIENEISRINSELVAERSKDLSKQDSGKLKQWEKALNDANGKLDDWVREVRLSDPRYAALKFPQPITLAETKRQLDDQSVMLAYSLGESKSYLFAVTKDGHLVKEIESSATIRQSVEKLLTAVSVKQPAQSSRQSAAEYREQAAILYQQLIAPAGELLKGKRELVIVADESLHRLPFELLLSAKVSPNQPWQQLPYLVKDFAISYSPSASVMAMLKNQKHSATPKDFVAFADPIYPNEDQMSEQTKMLASNTRSVRGGQLKLDRLPYSNEEVRQIAKLFPAGKADLFLRQDATEDNAKSKGLLGQYGIVHFSAHGITNEERPRFSGIVLSAAKDGKKDGSSVIEDGWLSAYEIFNLKLNADLVVLSACETGLGKEFKGDGLMSLARSFMYAGAPSVVVSLWKVDDKGTSDLMVEFYRQIKQIQTTERVTYSEALRQAQLKMIEKGNSPYFWAPFVLIGRQ